MHVLSREKAGKPQGRKKRKGEKTNSLLCHCIYLGSFLRFTLAELKGGGGRKGYIVLLFKKKKTKTKTTSETKQKREGKKENNRGKGEESREI